MRTWQTVLCIVLSVGGAFAAEPTTQQGAMVSPKLTEEEVKAIQAMSTSELAKLVQTGNRSQQEHAVSALVSRDEGRLLLGLARNGPRATNDVIFESFVPVARRDDDAEAQQLVDDYVSFMEGQLKSESPIVSPEQAVRCLGRVAYFGAKETQRPGQPAREVHFGYERVVGDLVGLLKDKRIIVGDAAVSWLDNVGGYTAEQALEVIAALGANRQTVAAQPVANKEESRNQEMRLAKINQAIRDVTAEQERRIKEAATQPDSPTRQGESPNRPANTGEHEVK